jgi:hypothetical protein
MTDSAVLEYSSSCGPRALAAIVGLPPDAAARYLAAAHAAVDFDHGAHGRGTRPVVLIATLSALGFASTPWIRPETVGLRPSEWTVGAWLRGPGLHGVWLLQVAHHVLVARSGAVAAGGPLDDWASHPIITSYLIEKRTS